MNRPKDQYPNALEVIRQITNLTGGQDCIFRGESKLYDYPCSSPLYRRLIEEKVNLRHISKLLRKRQDKLTTDADNVRDADEGSTNLSVLLEGLYWGEKTNLIGFTDDKLMALFFACHGNHDRPARVVIKRRSEFDHLNPTVDELPVGRVVLINLPKAFERAKDQNGVFIHDPRGLLPFTKEETVVIKAKWKQEILKYLENEYAISYDAISNEELEKLIKKQVNTARTLRGGSVRLPGFLNLIKTQNSSPTQFIYELLQNAEDANAREVRIKLTKYGLDFHHNGDDFNIEDIKGLVTLGFSRKSDDLTKAGQFGVGFKSVLRFTSTPRIFSGPFNIKIYGGICISKLESRAEDRELGTLIKLPFNYEKPESPGDFAQEDAFKKVQKELKEDLPPTTLLFLKSIRKIEWSIEQDAQKICGGYEKDSTEKKLQVKTPLSVKISKVRLRPAPDANNTDVQEYIVLKRGIEINHKELCVEAAFKLMKRKKQSKPTVVAEGNRGLVVLFPTKEVTYLNFLIQGPYRTVPSREGVPLDDNKQNEEIIEETGELVADSLIAIKSCKDIEYLYADFLSVLPIDPPNERTKENFIYTTLYYKLKEKLLSGGKSLPILGGGYASPRKSLIATGTTSGWLLEHLGKTDIQRLYSKEFWVDTKIATKLRNYLITEIKVGSITFETFVESIRDYGTAKFLGKKQDPWMIDFYSELLEYEPLWKHFPHGDDPFLRYEQIIKLNTRRYIAPFVRFDKKTQVYLPAKGRSGYPTVKEKFYTHKKSREFLVELGLKKPDFHDYVREFVISKYKEDDTIKNEENIKDFRSIFKSYSTIRLGDEKEKLRQELLKTEFVPAIDNFGKVCRSTPGAVYIPSSELRMFFKGDESVQFVSEVILEKDENGEVAKFLRSLGVEDKPKRVESQLTLTWDEKYSMHGGDCTDERGSDDYEYEGLENLIESGFTKEKSSLLWEFLLKSLVGLNDWQAQNFFKGVYRWFYYKDQWDYFPSKFLKTLRKTEWLVDKDDRLRKPSDITVSELSRNYRIEGSNADILVKVLEFAEEIQEDAIDSEDPETSFGESIDRTIEEMHEAGVSKEKIEDFREKWKEDAERLLSEARGDTQVKEEAEDETDENIPDTPIRRMKKPILKIRPTSVPSIHPTPGPKPKPNQPRKEANSTDKKESGWKVEKRVFETLKNEEEFEVVWLNEDEERGIGCDFHVKRGDEIIKYIEVKSKTKEDPKEVIMTGAQWHLAWEQGNKYFLYVVSNIRSDEDAEGDIYQNPVKLWKERKLLIGNLSIKLPKDTQDD